MLRTLTLASFLVLTLDVTGAALDAPWHDEAEAGCKKCDPRIKRGKLVIKKKKVGTVVKLPPVPPSGNTWSSEKGSPPISGVTFTFPGATAVSASNPIRAVSLFSGSLPEGTSLSDYTLEVAVRSEATGTKLAEDFKAPITLDPSGETVSGTSRIISRVLADGRVQIRIRNADRTWDPTLLGTVSLTPVKGDAVTLTNDEIVARYFAPLPEGFVLDKAITVKTTLVGLEGETLQTMSRTVAPETDAVRPALERARLSETRRGDARLATWTVSDGRPVSLEVEVVDDETGKVVLGSVDEAPVRSIRVYSDEPIAFEGGEDPAGTTYLLQIDALDGEGSPVGDQYEVELTMPKHTTGTATDAFVTWGGTDALGVVGVIADDDGYTLVATAEDDAFAEIQVAFLEPFEGPAPVPTELTLGLDVVFDRWVEKGSGPLPEECTVDSAIIDEGAVVDSIIVDGIGSGNVYSNGKGTSTATSAALRGNSVHIDLL